MSVNSVKFSQAHGNTSIINHFIPYIKRITDLHNLISVYLFYAGSIWEAALFFPHIKKPSLEYE